MLLLPLLPPPPAGLLLLLVWPLAVLQALEGPLLVLQPQPVLLPEPPLPSVLARLLAEVLGRFCGT
jgi:hypothetical protein